MTINVTELKRLRDELNDIVKNKKIELFKNFVNKHSSHDYYKDLYVLPTIAKNNWLAGITYMHDNHTDLNSYDEDHKYAIDIAVDNNYTNALRLLMKYGAKKSYYGSLMRLLIIKNRLADIKYAFENLKISLHKINWHDETTPLHIAVREGKYHIARYIINNIDDIDEEDAYGHTPMDILILKRGINTPKDIKFLRYLLKHKKLDTTYYYTHPNRTLYRDLNPLSHAVEHGLEDCINHLIYKRKLDMKFTDNYGKNYLHVAAYYRKYDIIQFLLKKASIKNDKNLINEKDGSGRTALNVIVKIIPSSLDEKQGLIDTIKCMLKVGVLFYHDDYVFASQKNIAIYAVFKNELDKYANAFSTVPNPGLEKNIGELQAEEIITQELPEELSRETIASPFFEGIPDSEVDFSIGGNHYFNSDREEIYFGGQESLQFNIIDPQSDGNGDNLNSAAAGQHEMDNGITITDNIEELPSEIIKIHGFVHQVIQITQIKDLNQFVDFYHQNKSFCNAINISHILARSGWIEALSFLDANRYHFCLILNHKDLTAHRLTKFNIIESVLISNIPDNLKKDTIEYLLKLIKNRADETNDLEMVYATYKTLIAYNLYEELQYAIEILSYPIEVARVSVLHMLLNQARKINSPVSNSHYINSLKLILKNGAFVDDKATELARVQPEILEILRPYVRQERIIADDCSGLFKPHKKNRTSYAQNESLTTSLIDLATINQMNIDISNEDESMRGMISRINELTLANDFFEEIENETGSTLNGADTFDTELTELTESIANWQGIRKRKLQGHEGIYSSLSKRLKISKGINAEARDKSLELQNYYLNKLKNNQYSPKRRYYMNNEEDIEALQKKCDFTYVNTYITPSGERINTHQNASKFKNNFYVAEVAKLGGSYGLFAAEDLLLKNKDVLGLYFGVFYNQEEVQRLNDKSYLFEFGNSSGSDARHYGNEMRFVNGSSNTFNCYTEANIIKDKSYSMPVVSFYSDEQIIRKGQQLFIDYHDTYEIERPIRLNRTDNELSMEEILSVNNCYDGFCFDSLITDSEFFTIAGIESKFAFFPGCLADWQTADPNLEPGINEANVNLPLFLFDQTIGQVCDYAQQPYISLLMIACYQGKVESVRYLLEKGADATHQNTITGQNAMYYAIASKFPSKRVIELLIEYGINLQVEDRDEYSLLHWCVKYNNLPALKLILDSISDKDEKVLVNFVRKNENNEKHCVLTDAILMGTPQVREYFLKEYNRLYGMSFFAHKENNEIISTTFKRILQSDDKDTAAHIYQLMLENGLEKNTLYREIRKSIDGNIGLSENIKFMLFNNTTQSLIQKSIAVSQGSEVRVRPIVPSSV